MSEAFQLILALAAFSFSWKTGA